LGEQTLLVNYGQVELSIKDTTGDKIVLKVAGEDDLFGELSLLDNRPRSATAMTWTETELFALDRDDLLFCSKEADAALNMLASMGICCEKPTRCQSTRFSETSTRKWKSGCPSASACRGLDRMVFGQHAVPYHATACGFLTWIIWNTVPSTDKQFDPFPFGLLTMIVSLEAIFLSCFVLISQNRQAAKDKIRADIEYDVNVKAELEIAHLHDKVDRLNEQMVEQFARLQPARERKQLTPNLSLSDAAAIDLFGRFDHGFQ
jgi:hypothetical protein